MSIIGRMVAKITPPCEEEKGKAITIHHESFEAHAPPYIEKKPDVNARLATVMWEDMQAQGETMVLVVSVSD